MGPIDKFTGGFYEKFGVWAEEKSFKSLFGGEAVPASLIAGSLEPQERRPGSLVAFGIVAYFLAHRCFIADDVQYIIGNLKRNA